MSKKSITTTKYFSFLFRNFCDDFENQKLNLWFVRMLYRCNRKLLTIQKIHHDRYDFEEKNIKKSRIYRRSFDCLMMKLKNAKMWKQKHDSFICVFFVDFRTFQNRLMRKLRNRFKKFFVNKKRWNVKIKTNLVCMNISRHSSFFVRTMNEFNQIETFRNLFKSSYIVENFSNSTFSHCM